MVQGGDNSDDDHTINTINVVRKEDDTTVEDHHDNEGDIAGEEDVPEG